MVKYAVQIEIQRKGYPASLSSGGKRRLPAQLPGVSIRADRTGLIAGARISLMWEELATLSASFWIEIFRSQIYSKLRFTPITPLTRKRRITGNLATLGVVYVRTLTLIGIQVSEMGRGTLHLSFEQKEGRKRRKSGKSEEAKTARTSERVHCARRHTQLSGNAVRGSALENHYRGIRGISQNFPARN